MKQQKLTIFMLSLLMSACITSQKPMQELYMAIHHRDVEKVEAILTENQEMLDLNEPFATGNTPLCLAVEREALHIAKLLISHGADVSQPGKHGAQPLHRVTHASMAAMLLEKGASPSATDEQGNTPLHRAKDAAIAKLLLEKGARTTVKNQHGFTPVETAVIQSKVDVLEELLKNWVVLSSVELESLHRMAKDKPSVARWLAAYKLPKSPVAQKPPVSAVNKQANTGKASQPQKTSQAGSKITPSSKPPTQVPPALQRRNCTNCNGSGVWETCQVCYGSGREQTRYQNADGSIETVTHQCTNGCINGKIICMRCRGRGFIDY